ncbi:alpha/beta fold hydrolase [Alteromonas flava]|uniref:alpha/beta fold hydrolase n=1 Tax=Alteromonas flava TaxID=2048003 RepID=UPI000C2864E4|nr:alpha/beta fold hydrolase [Alteromonas flava]
MLMWIVGFTLIVLTLSLFIGWLITKRFDKSLRATFPRSGKVTPVTGGSIHWTVSGHGTTVILVHGLAGNLHNFRSLEKALAEKYQVYCLDRPGSGHSGRKYRTDPSFTNQTRMIAEWMQKEGIEPAIFVGHSMGGAISLNLAINAPEKVKGLALICPLTAPLNIRPSRAAQFYFRSRLLRYIVAKVFSPLIHKKIGQRQVSVIFKPEKPPSNFAREHGGALAMLSDAFLAASGDLSNAQKSLREQVKQYKQIECPVSVLYGQDDRVLNCQEHTSMIEKTVPHAFTKVLPNKGHMLPITAVQECCDIIDEVLERSSLQYQ